MPEQGNRATRSCRQSDVSRPSAGRLRAAVIMPTLSVAAVLGVVSACSSRSCAGQCGPPYGLAVTFKAGATVGTATSALEACAKDPEVVYVGPPRMNSGVLSAGISTHDYGGPKTQPLLTCLRQSPAVASVGWPN